MPSSASKPRQCGYCLNGMTHHHQGATDAQSTPSEHEVLEALRYNLCRCGALSRLSEPRMRAAGHAVEARD